MSDASAPRDAPPDTSALPVSAKFVWLLLDEQGPCPQQAIERESGLADSTVWTALDALREAGLVTRERDPDDRRRYRYELADLTPEADDAAEPAWTPGDVDTDGRRCGRCDSRVSAEFWRVWHVDGELDGCRECLPRSVRFGEDVYGRAKDEAEAEFRDHEGF